MMSETHGRTGAADPDSDAFAQLFEASLAEQEKIQEGEIVHGTVVQVTRDHVVVDIGYKSEGVIPIGEFADTGGQIQVKAGDKVDVLIEARENEDGLVILSK